jgi:diguanylate cyclase (GGDEF)-like protein
LLPLQPGGLATLALESTGPLLLEDTLAAAPGGRFLADAGVVSSIVVPIISDRPLGLIGAHSCVHRRFTEHDAAFLSAAANIVAVAHGRLEAEATMRERATHDSLTGLPNRALLRDRLQAAVTSARRCGGACALLLMDLDRFKEVNDTLGHPVGDGLLRAVAERLTAVAGPDDTVARLGGDEFAIVLATVPDPAAAEAAAERVLRALADDIPVIDGLPIALDASIGVAVAPDHGDNPSVLLQRADLAMYRAKRLGTGVELYEAREDGWERRRLGLAGQLRSAIDEGQLRLAYQPKVSVTDGRVVGAEALVRWHHPEHGLLLPGAFLPAVEPTVTILALSRWVVREAVAQAARWRAEGHDLSVAINCSAREIQSSALPDQIFESLAEHQLPARLLTVELTESALITNPAVAMHTVHRLATAGVRISVDDFGTGFASLSLLERVPAAEIKIDRSFVSGVERGDPRAEAIVRTVLDLGTRLGIDVVAEGVETGATLERLALFGCRLVQGFLIAGALPPDEVPTAGRAVPVEVTVP